MLDHSYELVADLRRRQLDPLTQGDAVDDPQWLFGQHALRGLFDTPRAAPLAVRQDNLQLESDAEAQDRALIEQLIAATRLYATSDAIKELEAFAVRLRGFAPFNGMLLHIQKPGLTHAATAADWWKRFRRIPKPGTRPLLVLRTMGPVDFVFDILDTEGEAVPEQAFSFPTFGNVSQDRFDQILASVRKTGMEVITLDHGDDNAGWIMRIAPPPPSKARPYYRLAMNRNHPLPTQLVTVAHELAHLYLGHLGADEARKIRDRSDRDEAEREVEAEMAAYLVAKRNGLSPRSESYLDKYQRAFTDLDLYTVMRAAGAVETAMGISASQLKPHGTKGGTG